MIFTSLLFLAQTPPPGARPPDPGMNIMVMILFGFAVIYFVSIRPQQMRQKALLAQMAAIKTGDKVITNGGIHGMIANVKEKTFILKIADNVKIEVDKTAITTVVKSSEPAEAKA